MLGPRPSSATAPSIWYADVPAPQTKSGGKLSSTGGIVLMFIVLIFASIA
jgi:hypothetical protein